MSNVRKILVVILLIAASVLTYLVYTGRLKREQYVDLQQDGLGAVRSANYDYSFLISKDSNFGIGSVLNFTGSYLKDTPGTFKPWLSYSNPAFSATNRAANAANARWLVSTFDNFVREASSLTKVPRCIIYAIMLVESGSVASRAGNNYEAYRKIVNANPSGAYGPMQVKALTATDTVQIALNKGFLTTQHREIIADTIGQARADKIYIRETPNSRYFKDNTIIGYDGRSWEIQDDRLNIIIATLKLANLMDNYNPTNMHQVFYSYNQGDNTVKARRLQQYTSAAQFVKFAKGEGKLYVERTLGQHGAMDIIINDLRIFI